jgi:hypothetical protein
VGNQPQIAAYETSHVAAGRSAVNLAGGVRVLDRAFVLADEHSAAMTRNQSSLDRRIRHPDVADIPDGPTSPNRPE